MAPPSAIPPFVLLEDVEQGGAKLFEHPAHMITATQAGDVSDALVAMDDPVRAGHCLAGWIGYEAGHALEPRLAPLIAARRGTGPLLGMMAFTDCQPLDAGQTEAWLTARGSGAAALDGLHPAIAFADYRTAFDRVMAAIEGGDIYQANLTFPLHGRWSGNPIALYRAIRARSGARFAALIFDGRDWILSFSPELFFRISGRSLTVRPMKGTRPRGTTPEHDRRLARELTHSEKDRAENLMIVDLMRNDVSRICRPGSVKVDALFRVESYPTVFQMTTTVSGQLGHEPAIDRILRALFPCGSITGAPKLRAMEIIHEVETAERGIYCGAIGEIHGPSGQHCDDWHCRFNVAIRTLHLRADEGLQAGPAEYFVGSGIVADSVVEEEWAECLLKARFLTSARQVEPAAA